jgi:hypothetical protein
MPLGTFRTSSRAERGTGRRPTRRDELQTTHGKEAPERSLEVRPLAGREHGDERQGGGLSVCLPETSETGEHELCLVECDVGLGR